MNRISAVAFSALLAFSLGACAGASSGTEEAGAAQEESAAATEQEQTATEEAAEEESSSSVEVNEGLFEVSMTVPADFVGENTQEELDASAAERGFKSATLNGDGSVTYVMTKKQHDDFLKTLAQELDSSFDAMIGSADFPDITSIEHNADFTSFTVTTNNSELSMNESFSTLTFYIAGGMYTSFEGETTDNVHVDFVNAESGETIGSWDSRDMQ